MSAGLQSGSGTDRVKALVQAALLYADARAQLLQIEAQEAGQHLRSVIVALLLVIAAIAGAWLLLMPAAIFWLAERFQLPWTTLAFGIGALHLLVGGIAGMKLWRRLGRTRLFEESIQQLQNDRAWLTQQQ
jgi:uncharacterized membrane protein YqjE